MREIFVNAKEKATEDFLESLCFCGIIIPRYLRNPARDPVNDSQVTFNFFPSNLARNISDNTIRYDILFDS